jgi:hypothetical protein
MITSLITLLLCRWDAMSISVFQLPITSPSLPRVRRVRRAGAGVLWWEFAPERAALALVLWTQALSVFYPLSALDAEAGVASSIALRLCHWDATSISVIQLPITSTLMSTCWCIPVAIALQVRATIIVRT